MRTWVMTITRKQFYKVTLQAEDSSAAWEAGINLVDDNPSLPHEVGYVRGRMAQLGEPWAYCCGWYDLHGPGKVIVVDRADGNAYTKEDIVILRQRLESIGLTVQDSWNGAGCGQVSFECTGRNGVDQLTTEQLAILLAPRETA